MGPESAPETESADLGPHTIPDLDRVRRTGMPEAVYAAGKSIDQCVEIVGHLLASGDDPVIVTRATADQQVALAALHPTLAVGSTMTWRHRAAVGVGPVAIVSGGTSDSPVADECSTTLAAMGIATRLIPDVGVAGLHRLLDRVDDLRDASVIVAIAGMEASLPTVIGGLVAPPIIGVPTSVGYGSSLDGVTALLSLLASCAPGITVVGIDNGYGAACAAVRILGPVS